MADNLEFNGYTLSRRWFDYCMDNPDKIKPNHTALYFWVIETFNRFDWKQKVGLPTTHAMEVLGIKSYNTYIATLNDLVEFGFIIMVEKSKNQYSANIIALSNFNKARVKATLKQSESTVQSTVQSTCESIDSITKPINLKTIKPINKEREKKNFSPPSLLEVQDYITEKKYGVNAHSFWNFYESKNWMVGKNKMKDWAKAISGWESRNNDKSNQNQNQNGKQIANAPKQAYEFSVDRIIETYSGSS